jgi:hypothetical protein
LVHHVRFKYRSGRFPFHAPIESRFFKKVKGCPALFGQPHGFYFRPEDYRSTIILTTWHLGKIAMVCRYAYQKILSPQGSDLAGIGSAGVTGHSVYILKDQLWYPNPKQKTAFMVLHWK